MDYIDLKDIHDCKVRIEGKDYFIVCLVTKESKRYAMIAGGSLIKIGEETFDKLNITLEEHFKKHIFRK